MAHKDLNSAAHIAILGAGSMAPGIAAVFAGGGFEATLYARRRQAAEEATVRAEGALRTLFDNALAEGDKAPIRPTDDLEEAVSSADLVVEAISEDLSAKQALFDEVERWVHPESVLASTTSGLDIASISAHARHPSRFIVTHFWNPAHLVPLVEVLGRDVTDPGLLDDMAGLLCRLGKYPVRLEKYVPGFIGARLQQAVVREAIGLLQAGVASAEDIDAATRLSFGARFPVLGPLETTDLGGLDVIAAIHGYLLADLDCSQEPQELLCDLVDQGKLGVKTGAGFYDWDHRDAKELIHRRDEELLRRMKLLREQGELSGGSGSQLDQVSNFEDNTATTGSPSSIE
ncbi:MAG: 3-hydroxyacyl-CoA dehydrogenase NAD-binding domain-containing protein [Acidimicrobiia bacterium]|nr:3-hydroxyacyl-CoA dehydrogenase NAD-binding domain-containing protein [Acidimicrobiia bacterium]